MSHGTASLLGSRGPYVGGLISSPAYVIQSDDPFTTSTLVAGQSGASTAVSVVTFGGNTYSSSVRGYVAGGTQASPSATPASSTLLNLCGSGYGTAWVAGSKVAMIFASSELWSATANGTEMGFYTTLNTTTTLTQHLRLSNAGVFETGVSAKSMPAWGTNGALGLARNATVTDTSSSGTVASAVASSYLAPTFAASAATTFTDSATVYIAGAPANGTNVTLTNAYALWIDSGRIRYDETASASAATASTHKVPINIGGTLYYILLTNV